MRDGLKWSILCLGLALGEGCATSTSDPIDSSGGASSVAGTSGSTSGGALGVSGSSSGAANVAGGGTVGGGSSQGGAGSSGSAGATNVAGAGGSTGGAAGKSGAGGTSGSAGAAGNAGTGGGSAGSAGNAGSAGSAGASGGTGNCTAPTGSTCQDTTEFCAGYAYQTGDKVKATCTVGTGGCIVGMHWLFTCVATCSAEKPGSGVDQTHWSIQQCN